MDETPAEVTTAEDENFAVLECFTPGYNKERLLIQHSLDEDSIMLEDPLQTVSSGRLTWAYGDETENDEDVKGGGTETETSSSASTSNSYRDEWVRLFEGPDYIDVIKQEGLKGGLRSSRFRSVCWRVYLEVLPERQDQWAESVRNDRERYAAVKRMYVVDPQTGFKNRDADLSLNNPLSQDEESPWNRFFQDKECRQEISQDVKRTFPEIEFFQTDEMHDMMVNILFCYCKEHEDLGYKQGMHEVLAPLIFILHCDQQAFLHAQEIKSQMPVVNGERDVVQEIMDPNFLEHDSYTMFYHLMDTMEPWYRHGMREEGAIHRNASFTSAEPFAKPQECSPSSPLIKKLTKIQDVVLKMHDSELHMHLTRLDIQPQIFGIRWVRLLFGREFTLQDLLVLWDTIFADSVTLDLIDYIFVAMLILVRELLLSGDYADCMSLLMRFPMVGDVRCLVDKALHLRDPKKFPRPPNYQFQILQHSDAGVVIPSSARSPRRQYANGAVFSGSSANTNPSGTLRNKKASVMTSGLSGLKRIANKGKQNEDKESAQGPSHPLASPADVVSEVKSRPLKVKTISPQQETNMQSFTSDGIAGLTSNAQAPKKDNLGGLFSKSRSAGKKNQQKEQEMDFHNQVAFLQGKMNDVQNMCRYCATKMEAHLMQIQDEMVKLKLTQEDELLLAVAGLKQVKDILNGTLKFAQGMEEQEDLIMNDDYYGKEELTPSPPVSKMDLSPESEPDSNGSQPKVMELEELSPDVGSSSSSADSDPRPETTPAVSLNTSECNNNLGVPATSETDNPRPRAGKDQALAVVGH
ncbi:TBC1 domain family member 5-like isoform X3 [Acanthaster planci]|uniref:TBC1 domain family member 5-like isoform X3 n=1 Tax=Acanthaster planci TaxID=133434 RepID=A0A8B7ZRR7_ACAPL|nr:TBC1 domain family member 5-like isoform X3 [Acanthaster planci]